MDQDGEIVDVFVQKKRDGKAAKRFFARLLSLHGRHPRTIVRDRLKSYGVAHRDLTPGAIHDTSKYANSRSERSHQSTRVREPGMRRSKSPGQAQRFLTVHAALHNLFNLGRQAVPASNYREMRARAFETWAFAAA
ncbi:MAG: DDE-type integrase/transposase/recombinase [Burkholderiaceae bacterium]